MKYIAFFVGILVLPALALAHEGEDAIYIIPDSLVYEAGDEIVAQVWLDVPEPVTSFRIHLSYDVAALEVREIKANTEPFPFWWNQEAGDGVVELEGSAPAPGVAGEVLVAEVTLAAQQAGNTLLAAREADSLLLNAQDENLLVEREAPVQLEAPQVAESKAPGVLLGIGVLLVGGIALGAFLVLQNRKK